ncbi:MAG: hypothetical protein ABJA90_09420 [Ginsengibacter sp.]
MIKYSELKKGDYVLAESDGQAWQGEVTKFNNDEKEISVYNGVQDFYFKADDLYPLPLDEKQLMKLNFKKQINEDGSIKYMKDAFRIKTSSQDNFSNFELWYRNEKRIMLHPISVHQLQNHHYEMTKVHLTDAVV